MKTRSRAKGLTALLTIALFATTAACCPPPRLPTAVRRPCPTDGRGALERGCRQESYRHHLVRVRVHEGLAQPIPREVRLRVQSLRGLHNGPPVVQALQTGDVQVGLIGDTPAVQAKASGIDVPALVIDKPSSDIWFLGREGGVSKIEDLAGKKVGLQFGSNFDKYGRAVLERAGVADKVELVNLLFADALPALQRGDIDAVPLPARQPASGGNKSTFLSCPRPASTIRISSRPAWR